MMIRINQLKLPLDMMVTASGKFRETRHYNTLQVSLAVGLGAVLGLLFGVPGIVIGIINVALSWIMLAMGVSLLSGM